MNRKEFIKTCGCACVGGLTMLSLGSCVVSNVSSTIVGTDVIVPLDSFKDSNHFIVDNERLQFPIYVFKIADNDYSAVLMSCTHQGTELQAFGEILECSAHGSQFDQMGNVKVGPASENLHKFPVTIKNNQLKISLKNV